MASSPTGPSTVQPESKTPTDGPVAAAPDDHGEFLPRRAAAIAWIVGALGVTLFKQNIVVNYFPVWIVANMGGNEGQIALMNGMAMALLLAMEPWLGALSDHLSSRRILFIATIFGSCVLTFFLGTNLWASLAFFVVGYFLFRLAMVMRNALLPAVSTRANRGRIEGYADALGWVGALAGLALGYTAINGATVAGISLGGGDHPAIFRITAIGLLLLSLPVLIWVKEPPRPAVQGRPRDLARRAFQDLGRTAREARSHPDLARLLVGRTIYMITTNAVGVFAAVYITLHLKVGGQEKDHIFLFAILGGAVGSVIWGHLVDHYGPRDCLMRVLALWAVALAITAVTGITTVAPQVLWVLGVLVGFAGAGIGTADLPLLVALTPSGRIGQYNGLYAFSARVASLTGPVVWALVAFRSDVGRPLVLLLLLLLTILSIWVLRPLSSDLGRPLPPQIVPGAEPSGHGPVGAAPSSGPRQATA